MNFSSLMKNRKDAVMLTPGGFIDPVDLVDPVIPSKIFTLPRQFVIDPKKMNLYRGLNCYDISHKVIEWYRNLTKL